MKKEDIKRLPPELQRAAEIKRSLRPEQRARWERRLAEGMDETEDFPACTPDQRAILWTLMELKSAEQALESSLTYCLQMQEANASLRRRIHYIEAHNQYFERCESSWCNPDEKYDAALEAAKGLEKAKRDAEATIATLTRERDALRGDLYELRGVVTAENFAEMQQRAETAEAEVTCLRGELEKAQEMIAILWQNGKFGMSVGNALSEDGVLKKAIAADKERKTGAALSHTPEGGGQ